MTRRPSARRWLITVAVFALLAAMAVRLLTSYEDLAQFQRLSTRVLLATVCSQLLSVLLWNGAMLLPLRTYMKRLGFWELFMVRTGGFVAGYIVPVAGNLAVRMAYLKRRGLTYAEFTWATLLSSVLALFSGAALAVVALGALWMRGGTPPASVIGLTAAVLALGLAGITVFQYVPRLACHPRLQKWPWLSGMSGFTTSHRTAAWALALLVMRQCFNFLTFGLLFQSLSRAPIGFVTGGLVYAITTPLRIVAITPGNLGVDEWVMAIVGSVLSVDLTTGLIVALLFRGVSLAGQTLGVLIGWAWLRLWSTP
ncbi:MAG: hypothetical protein A3G25_18995 [Betaproteobacteria bacterium RIFCSPLOWO2_12_FULL_63_13]|nr:MAG: hypothetical protein A3G25_18995 [Betaproteobacteria bacterium RIFCSPLOWO2_12_FULL_63_13]